MRCSPSVTLLLLPSRDSLRTLPKTALLRSQTRMSVLPRSRSLLSLRDWLKYLPSHVSVLFKFLKDSQSALLPFSGRLLVICWLVSAWGSFTLLLHSMSLLGWVVLISCARRQMTCLMHWMYLGNGIFLNYTALTHVFIAVILTMAYPSALNPIIKQELIGPR